MRLFGICTPPSNLSLFYFYFYLWDSLEYTDVQGTSVRVGTVCNSWG